MSETPFFSIVTPTYNRAHYLREMLESVQTQSITDYEHIIVDDGSTDGTEDLVSSLSKDNSRIVYIKQENQGRSAARNVGIRSSKGSYICFLDSDDHWRSNHLEVLQSAIKGTEHPTVFITGLTWMFEDDNNREEDVIYRPRHLYTSEVEYVTINQFAPDCVCIPKEALEKHQFNPQLFVNEDLELWARIAAEYPVETIDIPTAVLRVHGGNTSKTEARFNREARKVFQLQLATPAVRKHFSKAFIKDRIRGLHELTIKHYQQIENRPKFLWWTSLFILRYPRNPSVLDKIKLMGKALTGAKLS